MKRKSPAISELGFLVLAAVATIVIWQLPFGRFVLYPFTILATWFHEMGHGLAALLLGANFHKLVIYSNGSGFAEHSGALMFGPFGRAIVSAAGPLGPPIAGAILIFASNNSNLTKAALLLLGGAILLSTAIWVRFFFGILALPIIGLGIFSVAHYCSESIQAFTIQFLGVQACISSFNQIDYLFTKSVEIGNKQLLSDSSRIAESLLLPYWFWGALMTVCTFSLLGFSLWKTHR